MEDRQAHVTQMASETNAVKTSNGDQEPGHRRKLLPIISCLLFLVCLYHGYLIYKENCFRIAIREKFQAAGVDASVNAVSVSLLKGTVTLEDIRIVNPRSTVSGHFASYQKPCLMRLKRLVADIERPSLCSDILRIDAIHVTEPMLFFEEMLVIEEDATYEKSNIQAMIPVLNAFILQVSKSVLEEDFRPGALVKKMTVTDGNLAFSYYGHMNTIVLPDLTINHCDESLGALRIPIEAVVCEAACRYLDRARVCMLTSLPSEVLIGRKGVGLLLEKGSELGKRTREKAKELGGKIKEKTLKLWESTKSIFD